MKIPFLRVSPSPSSGFTLTELAILLAIVGILSAILIPVGQVIRDHARGAICASNLGQLMTGMFQYADDHEGSFPPIQGDGPASTTWHGYLASYVGLDASLSELGESGITWRSNSRELTAFNCPVSMEELITLPNADNAHLNPWFLYGLNADLPLHAIGRDRRSGKNISVDDVIHPEQTMAILETSDWSAAYAREIGDSTGTGRALIPHGMAANVAFYDGSVRRIPYLELIAYESSSLFWAGGYAD